MKDKVFVDTNILVYAVLESDKNKHEQALDFFTGLKGRKVFMEWGQVLHLDILSEKAWYQSI